MTAVRLVTRRVEKPWGRRDLLPAFGNVSEAADPVGEIWFEDPRGGEPDLLVKYLFTSEKLSIQVHPDDEAARARGHRRGKEEAWLILDADPGAVIGIGLKAPVDRAELRAASLDGRIEEMLDWRPAQAGDYFYSPAGTIHALGPGLKLIEVQQNVDLTYRLYDYGRPRELHLEEALAVADPSPYRPPFEPYPFGLGRVILAEGRKFVLERWFGPVEAFVNVIRAQPLLAIPVEGAATLDEHRLQPGEAWLIDEDGIISLTHDAELLVAYSAERARFDLLK